MQEDEELTLEDVEDKIETLDSDIQRELKDIKDRLDAQENVLISVNETLDRIEGYLSNTLGDELETIEKEVERIIKEDINGLHERIDLNLEYGDLAHEGIDNIREYLGIKKD